MGWVGLNLSESLGLGVPTWQARTSVAAPCLLLAEPVAFIIIVMP